jgi:hypothetical protein
MSGQYWEPSRLLRVILLWLAITFITGWLPMIRGAFDGPTYSWATSYFGKKFSGSGTGADYWLPIAKSIFAIIVLYLGWRGARIGFLVLALLWQTFGFADALYSSITTPDDFRFKGDTLGVDVSLAWVAPTAYGIFLLLTIFWARQNARREWSEPVPPWSRKNSAWLIFLIALLPIQFVLLHFGPHQSTSDVIGVFITIFQWLFVAKAFRPYALKQYVKEI